MERYLLQKLVFWKESPSRMPLLIRGARQTGKTYLVEEFGRHYFKNFLTVNFELNPEYKSCFTTLQPEKILLQLQALTRKEINPGQTLLFFDEIQECPEAIQSLRYFKEQFPNLHIAGAGSLLEFALNEAEYRMPVGRVEFLYLYPMNFIEFLYALGESKIVDFLKTVTFAEKIPDAIHNRCLWLLRLYSIIGGMPAVVKSYIQEQNLERVQSLQINLIATYRNDFGKYANLVQQTFCQAIFNKMPELTSKHFKYVDVDPNLDNRNLKIALKLLIKASIISQIKLSTATGLPLNANINEKKFKLLFLDIGLIKAAGRLDNNLLLTGDIMDIREGTLSEQLVGQQLISLQPPYEQAELFFWQRDKKGSQAEIDYLWVHNEHIIPLEVKSGKTGRLLSLNMFLEEKNSPFGIQVSILPLEKTKRVLSIPIYLINELPRLLNTTLPV